MKILCVIDHFGSGGTQRQMVNLACGLKKRGHDVEVFIYFPQYSFFYSQVEASNIPIYEYPKGRGFSFGILRKLISLIQKNQYEIVVSFLNSPNVYAELSCLFAPFAQFVVSERSSHHSDKSVIGALFRRNLHRLANCVVTNSVKHRDWLNAKHVWIKGRCTTIYNGVDTSFFKNQPKLPFAPEDIRLIGVGRVGFEKNLLNLIKGLRLFYDNNGWLPSISWVGRQAETTRLGQTYCQQVDELLDALPEVKGLWSWLGERSDIPALLSSHQALIHSSFYEGLPNAICEALAAGRPVLASDVSDNSVLVSEGERGFLFDPNQPESIADAIKKLVNLSTDDWINFSRNAREYAEANLGIEKMVKAYEALFSSLVESPPDMTVGIK